MRLAGRLNVPAQTIEMESSTAGGETLPLAVRFRCSDYLSQPHWGVALNWNRFPAGPVLDLARQMGADLPPKLNMTGSLDGVLGYTGQGSLEGVLDFHDASIAIPDSPPIRSAQARLVFDGGHARLAPAQVRTAQDETAQLEADYDWKAQSLDLTISTDAMRVESLRAQAALAAIPWLDQVSSGTWKGQLRYQIAPPRAARAGQRFHAGAPIEDRLERRHRSGRRPVSAAGTCRAGGGRIGLRAYRRGPRDARTHPRAGRQSSPFKASIAMSRRWPGRIACASRIAEADAAELERLLHAHSAP